MALDWSPHTEEDDMSDSLPDKPSQAEGDVGDDGPSNLHAHGEGTSASADTEHGETDSGDDGVEV